MSVTRHRFATQNYHLPMKIIKRTSEFTHPNMRVGEVFIGYEKLTPSTEQQADTTKTRISTSRDLHKYLTEQVYNPYEIEHRDKFYAVVLDRHNKINGFMEVGAGGISGTVADIRIIMQFALLSNACSIILSHNHPSGNLKPSPQDIDLTKQMAGACKIMEISLLDHIIISAESYFSFADEGLQLN